MSSNRACIGGDPGAAPPPMQTSPDAIRFRSLGRALAGRVSSDQSDYATAYLEARPPGTLDVVGAQRHRYRLVISVTKITSSRQGDGRQVRGRPAGVQAVRWNYLIR